MPEPKHYARKGVATELPTISYTTWMMRYMFGSLVLNFIVLIEFLVVTTFARYRYAYR